MKRPILLGVLVLAVAAADAETLVSRTDAVAQIFPEASSSERIVLPITREIRARILKSHKIRIGFDEVEVFVSSNNGQLIGRTFIISEAGKHGMIWVAAGIVPGADGRPSIRKAVVCAYKEIRGRPTAERTFMDQYNGKILTDPFKVGKDIQALTGATVSSTTITRAVHEALLLASDLFRD